MSTHSVKLGVSIHSDHVPGPGGSDARSCVEDGAPAVAYFSSLVPFAASKTYHSAPNASMSWPVVSPGALSAT